MSNPWLSIPLADYEGHMALPEVGQADMLADEFSRLLLAYAPKSAALIGCAGGNGFVEAAEAGLERLIGLDINAGFVAEAAERFAPVIPGLQVLCADIAGDLPELEPVDFVYAALVFEYVEVPAALRNLRSLCRSGGHLATLLQMPKQGAASVTPSPFTSLASLSSLMRLVPPDALRTAAQTAGFSVVSEKLVSLQSGKQFCLQVFN